jgi:hypothetical protein
MAMAAAFSALWIGLDRSPRSPSADPGPIRTVAASSPPHPGVSSGPATRPSSGADPTTGGRKFRPVPIRKSRSASSGAVPARTTSPPVPGAVATTRNSLDPEPPVEQERDVWIDLSRGTQLMDIDYWGHMPQVGGDLNITASGLEIATDRAGIAIVPKADWATCSTRTSWVQVIVYGAVHAGSQLCAYTPERRFARLSIEVVPGGQNPQLRFYGYTWDVS